MTDPRTDLRAAYERVTGLTVDWDNVRSSGYEPAVDADTRMTRGGKSTWAIRRERRMPRPIHRDGAVSFNGGMTWRADGGEQ